MSNEEEEEEIFHKTIFYRNGIEEIKICTPVQYSPLELIEKGSQGVVCKGWDNDNHGYVAIKKPLNPFSNVQEAKSLFREFQLSSIIDHKHIIRLKNAYTPQEYEDFTEIYMVYEYMDMNLLTFHNRNRSLFEGKYGGEFIGYLIHQLFQAFQYLHEQQLIHRDLKQQNILLKKPPNSSHKYDYLLKVGDFGLARQLPFSEDNQNLTKSIGTLSYRAPEICMSRNYGTALDMWSIGCLIYELITGKRLFIVSNEMELLRSVIKTIPLSFEELSTFSPSIFGNAKTYNWSINLLEQKLEGYGSQWDTKYVNILNFKDLLNGLLAFDPAKRLTAEEILKMPLWNYLPKTFYKNVDKSGKMGIPYKDEYGSNGTIKEWKDRLYESVKEYQKCFKNKKQGCNEAECLKKNLCS